MKKRNFNHWNKIELHDYFLNLHHMTETSVYKVSAMTATELKKCCPFLSLSHSKNNRKTQPKAIQTMLLIMRLEGNISRNGPNIFPTNSKWGGKDPSLLTSYSSL